MPKKPAAKKAPTRAELLARAEALERELAALRQAAPSSPAPRQEEPDDDGDEDFGDALPPAPSRPSPYRPPDAEPTARTLPCYQPPAPRVPKKWKIFSVPGEGWRAEEGVAGGHVFTAATRDEVVRLARSQGYDK